MSKKNARRPSSKEPKSADKGSKPSLRSPKTFLPSSKPAKPKEETLQDKTKRIALDLIKKLPPELREPASEVLIVVKKRPTGDMDEFLMGLFEGPTLEEFREGGFEFPPRITLFSQNIWEESENDPQAFEEEVRVTLYHELGHFLGLDEDDLEQRELG